MAGPRRSAIPWGAIGAIALLGLVEHFVAIHWLALTDPVSLSWRYSAQAAENEARDCQVLCLGDSLVKHGLIPSVFERVSGDRVLNLSAAQASTILTHSLLRRAFGAGARPRALIINAKPAVLLGGPECNTRSWQEILSLHDGLELLQVTRNAPFVASTMVGRLLPSLRARLEIQSSVTGALRGDADRVRAINPVLWRNWSVNGGANVASARVPFDGEVTSQVRRQLYTELFYVDPANAQAIEQTLQLADDRRIPVFWVLPPISPKLQSLRDQSGADRLHDEFLRSIIAQHAGGVTVLDARHSGYPAASFVDATHLNRRGALALSDAVADIVAAGARSPQKAVSIPGWIELAPPTDRSAIADLEIEDVEQSARVVRPDPDARVSLR